MADGLCSVEGCDRKVKARGWCHTHYVQWHRTGEPPSEGPIAARVHGSIDARLAAHTARIDDPAACHLWVGSTNPNGYGQVRIAGRLRLAHRMAYENAYGPIPAGQVVDHACSTPTCVNPRHLRAGSQKQNMEHLRAANRGNRSGVRGVTWHAETRKWRAQVMHHRRNVHVGLFATVAAAETAVIAKRNELFTHNDADRS